MNKTDIREPSPEIKTGKPNGWTPPADAEDLSSFWIDTGFSDPLTTEHILRIPVDKPRDFFRTHPGAAYRRKTEVYAHKSENTVGVQYYMIDSPMHGRIHEARPCILVTVIDRAGMPRLWPISMPRDDENDNDAWTSARAAAREGMERWTKLLWKGRSYITRAAEPGYAPDPDWSRLPSFDELVNTAFGKHGKIRDETHPIYKDLFGKAAEPADADPLL